MSYNNFRSHDSGNSSLEKDQSLTGHFITPPPAQFDPASPRCSKEAGHRSSGSIDRSTSSSSGSSGASSHHSRQSDVASPATSNQHVLPPQFYPSEVNSTLPSTMYPPAVTAGSSGSSPRLMLPSSSSLYSLDRDFVFVNPQRAKMTTDLNHNSHKAKPNQPDHQLIKSQRNPTQPVRAAQSTRGMKQTKSSEVANAQTVQTGGQSKQGQKPVLPVQSYCRADPIYESIAEQSETDEMYCLPQG